MHILIISIPHGKDITIAKILEFARTKWPIDKYLPDLKKDWFPPRECVCNISKQALWLILMYSSYIDSEGVWKLDREENGEKRRSIYWEERTENGCASRIQGVIW